MYKKSIQKRALSSDFSRTKFEGLPAMYISSNFFLTMTAVDCLMFMEIYWCCIIERLLHSVIIHCYKLASDVCDSAQRSRWKSVFYVRFYCVRLASGLVECRLLTPCQPSKQRRCLLRTGYVHRFELSPCSVTRRVTGQEFLTLYTHETPLQRHFNDRELL